MSILVLLILFVILAIRAPHVQTRLTGWATYWFSSKTGAQFHIDRLYLTFRGDLQVNDLLLADPIGDTLLYSSSLEVRASLPGLWSGDIALTRITWEGAEANIQVDSSGIFNFQFIIYALGPPKPSNEPNQAESLNLSLGSIHLQNIDFRYLDQQNGIDVSVDLDRLELLPGSLKPDELLFEVRSATIEGLQARVDQWVTTIDTNDNPTMAHQLPEIIVDALDIRQVDFQYNSLPDTLALNSTIGQLGLEKARLTLATSSIEAQRLLLEGSAMSMSIASSIDTVITSTSTDVFKWPEWKVDLKDLDIKNTAFRFDVGPAAAHPLFIDPQKMSWQVDALDATDIHFAPADVGLNLNQLHMLESNHGLELAANISVQLDKEKVNLSIIDLSTAHSELSANIKAAYETFDLLIDDPTNINVLSEIKTLKLGTEDLQQLDYLLQDYPQFAILLEESIGFNGSIDYSPTELDLDNLQLSWSDQTKLNVDAQLFHLYDSTRTVLDLSQLLLTTQGADMSKLKAAFDLPVDLPNQIRLKSDIQTSPSRASGKLAVDSNEGDMTIEFELTDSLAQSYYDLAIQFQGIDLGKWLETNQLGKVDGGLIVSGIGSQLSNIVSKGSLQIEKLELLDQHLADINLNLNIDHGQYDLKLDIDEPSIAGTFAGTGQFSSAKDIRADMHMSLDRFDLQAWQLAKDSIIVSSEIDLALKHSSESSSLSIGIAESRFLTSDNQHVLKPIRLNLSTDEDSTSFSIVSGLLSADVQLNSSIDTLSAMSSQWEDDFPTLYAFHEGELLDGLIAVADVKVHPTSDEFEQIWPQVRVEDTMKVKLNLNQPKDIYDLDISMSALTYNNISLSNAQLVVSNKADTMAYLLDLDGLRSGPVQISHLSSGGWYHDLHWQNGLAIKGVREHLMLNIDTKHRWSSDTVFTHIIPETLVLDSLSWTLPQHNQIAYHQGRLYFRDFKLGHDNDLLEVLTTEGPEEATLNLRFQDFELQTLTSMINATRYPASGEINGFVNITGSGELPAVSADLEIQDLVMLQQPLGLLQWRSSSEQFNSSSIDLKLTSPQLDIMANGQFEEDGQLDLNLHLNRVDMSVIEGFAEGKIKHSKGHIAGRLQIIGPETSPQYGGAISFDNVSFTATDVNAPFRLENESISIENEMISFERFTVLDQQSNTLELNGNISIADFSDPHFDFTISAQDFQLLNSTDDDNDLYYGQVTVDIDLSVNGSQSIPTVSAVARLNEGSQFTYILPESQLEIEEREGVLMFFDQTDSSTLIEAAREPPKIIDLPGVQLNAKLEVDPETNFKMIIDQRSGDYLEVGGKANLNINIDRKGKAIMIGVYTAQRGAYEVKLYEIVQRRFEVVPGSRIIWTGDPYEAELDLTAQYNLRASIRELMEQQVANADPTTKVASRQDLPFEVLLNIQGSLEQPLMSFRLDMPVNARNELGGNVYARINQINEDEEELNKQVFSLVAFNQFLPSAVTNATGATTANIARSSVNQILSSQLNNLSSRYIKGIDVDFNLNSFSDYQTGNTGERTELSVSIKKALFDDRVIISVGNSVDLDGQTRQNNEWAADVSVEYLLTEDGRYRVKGFQKNSFEDLVEGQVIITGLSLLFRKDFNQFRNIFNGTDTAK